MADLRGMINRRRALRGTVLTGMSAAGLLAVAQPAGAATTVPILNDNSSLGMPRRAFDSRSDPAASGGGKFFTGNERRISVDIEPNPIKSGNHAFLNVTVTQTTGSGYLTIYPADESHRPAITCISWFGPNQTLTSGTLTRCQVAVSTAEPAWESFVKVYCGGGGSAHVILDLTARWKDQTI